MPAKKGEKNGDTHRSGGKRLTMACKEAVTLMSRRGLDGIAISKEDSEIASRYGKSTFGQACISAFAAE
ncbi:hypothetical protein N9B39_02915 [bacterium]|nr:hypothetical protein [bacterium]